MPFAWYVREQALLVFTVILQEVLYQLLYLAPCLLVGRLVVRRLCPARADSVFGAVSSIAIGLGIIGLATLALGLSGGLSGTSAWLVLAGAAAIGLIDIRNLSESISAGLDRFRGWLDEPSAGGWIWLPAVLLMVIPLVGSTLLPGTLWRPDDPHPYDSLVYHLQVPREWYELGKIVPLRHNVYSFFPFNVEMHYLLANHLRGGPWTAMQQNQLLSFTFTVLASLGMWGWLKPRVGGRGSALAAMAMLTMPWILMLACVTYVESGMLLWGVLTLAWFVEAMESKTAGAKAFIIAGLFCGLVCGAKLTGVPMFMAALPMAGLFGLAVTGFKIISIRRYIVGCAVFGLVAFAVLSPWLVRNYAWTANPLFPMAMKQLGQAHFSDVQVERWERAHRATASDAPWPERMGRLVTQVVLNWRFNYVVFPLAIAAVFFHRRDASALTAIALLALMTVFWLLFTHLMGRFFVLSVIPAALLVAMLPTRWITASAILVTLMAINSWIGVTLPLDKFQTARNLDMVFGYYAEQGRQGLYGLQDYSQIDPPELKERIDRAHEVVLVGDTQAFYRQIPIDRLRYCTVFDLNLTGGRDIIDAYYAPPPERCPFDVLLLIDKPETQRLHETYWQVPLVDPPAPGRVRDYMFVPLGPH